MTVKELKDKLINEINQSQDNELLEDMYRLIKIHEDPSGLYNLSDEQIKSVEEAQLQFKNGQFLTGEKADKEIDEWLGK